MSGTRVSVTWNRRERETLVESNQTIVAAVKEKPRIKFFPNALKMLFAFTFLRARTFSFTEGSAIKSFGAISRSSFL